MPVKIYGSMFILDHFKSPASGLLVGYRAANLLALKIPKALLADVPSSLSFEKFVRFTMTSSVW